MSNVSLLRSNTSVASAVEARVRTARVERNVVVVVLIAGDEGMKGMKDEDEERND